MNTERRELHLRNVEKNRQLALDAMDYLWKNPETGYKEWKGHAYLAERFEALGYTLTLAGNIPGFCADLDTGRPGPCVAVFGELDALVVEEHPEADPDTFAVHACGHCCQAAGLLGLAAALKEPGALEGLSGKIRLIAVPAEELIEVEFREKLRQDGVIRYYGGKTEFMARGLLDGVDLAMMCHSTPAAAGSGSLAGGSNGFIAKQVTFVGRSAHAGGSPHLGINALYAANLGLNAINALRETFQDSTHIRVHPIITNGGTVVNAIPEKVTMESYLRGTTMEAIRDANDKVNRALAASAAAIGARVVLCDRPGYYPRNYDRLLMDTVNAAMESVLEKVTYNPTGWGSGSSDMGDVGAVMPTVHPGIGGVSGTSHGMDYCIMDGAACLDMAKVHAAALELLLENGAARANEIVRNYKPDFASIPEYLAYADSFMLDRDAVRYDGKGNAILNLGHEELTF